jgi:Glycosyltransferase family 28 C-terminal domain
VIGWYVHHRGLGHLHRARAVDAELTMPMTVLSSLPQPVDWDIPWVALERDDQGDPQEPDAREHLHWAPLQHAGLRTRMAAISEWIAHTHPRLVVCDVSVEVALLCRLHGVPVVCVVMPGDRSDAPHRLGYGIATQLVGCWPEEAQSLGAMVKGIRDADAARMRLVGAMSRFPVPAPRPRRPGPPRVAVLMGEGGHSLDATMLAAARQATPQWEWTILDRELGTWHDDPFAIGCDADVVVTHAGQNALAEVAAARRPAVVVPFPRPHGEQHATAGVLARGPWPAVVVDRWPVVGWGDLLAHAARLPGALWESWCDGKAAGRFADIVEETAARDVM